MRIALVGDSSRLFMPYVRNYESILRAAGVEHLVITWDRTHAEERSAGPVFRDRKTGHRRTYLDYWRYGRFVVRQLERTECDRLIVFGIPLSHMLGRYLMSHYRGRYVVDIRDYHRLLKVTNMGGYIDRSAFTVVSSPAYAQWLPKGREFVVNHNTKVESLDELKEPVKTRHDREVVISTIGAIRDYRMAICLIDSLKHSQSVVLRFDGEGICSQDIARYVNTNSIANVRLTGRYSEEDEDALYGLSDLVAICIPSDGVNNRTLLPNRLYNSLKNGKPMIALSGTYVAQIIQDYGLGLVVNSFEGLEQRITRYLNDFDIESYKRGRLSFFAEVFRDNSKFRSMLAQFCGL